MTDPTVPTDRPPKRRPDDELDQLQAHVERTTAGAELAASNITTHADAMAAVVADVHDQLTQLVDEAAARPGGER